MKASPSNKRQGDAQPEDSNPLKKRTDVKGRGGDSVEDASNRGGHHEPDHTTVVEPALTGEQRLLLIVQDVLCIVSEKDFDDF
ncbi:expressed unknown protein [Seminavis robusta]|uniref:Uncharacterized protein n=1 Tax=Seminavis robusta TaxID=568900 RepID=A0A9N8E3U7_9STRA|nr:expressed unknown protein [Seminavis robusta]|eukprot:Sro622_g176970.1 n/a (83) ;mRNA; r:31989-32237